MQFPHMSIRSEFINKEFQKKPFAIIYLPLTSEDI